jgi:hypothetical protein
LRRRRRGPTRKKELAAGYGPAQTVREVCGTPYTPTWSVYRIRHGEDVCVGRRKRKTADQTTETLAPLLLGIDSLRQRPMSIEGEVIYASTIKVYHPSF